MSERDCRNCKWVSVREPDYEPLCYALDCEHSMDNVLARRPWENGACDKWEAKPCADLDDC